ncbi:MAG TPA: hypothetical protein VMV57_00575 [Terracidiphilus sp.]|nr:hypothetical protein [Terracidiphilus sp.]
MARRIFQLVAGLVLIFATLTPLANCFDTWDRYSVPANDTEVHVAAWFACAGFLMAMGKLMRYRPAFAGAARRSGDGMQAERALRPVAEGRPESTSSPPLIPLRI